MGCVGVRCGYCRHSTYSDCDDSGAKVKKIQGC